MMTKFFQIFLLLVGILFLYITIGMMWGLIQPPDHEYLASECSKMIQQGDYYDFSEANKLNACLDDSYEILAEPPLGIIATLMLISWLSLRYGFRIFKK